MISVAITIGLALAIGELQKLWIIPVSGTLCVGGLIHPVLIGYTVVSAGLFGFCLLDPSLKSQNQPTMHLKVFLIMLGM